MKIAFVAAGAAGMYCGSCLRDNALAGALRALGEDVLLVPAYTPLRVDEESAAGNRVFFNAVDVFLQEKVPWMRSRPGLLGKLLASDAVLRIISRLPMATSPARLGPLTVSMLRGEEGRQKRSLLELSAWLASERPDIVHLSNSLLSGMARELRRALGVPIVCGLQGEDLFLAGLPEPYRREASDLIRRRGEDIDRFIATSRWCADSMAEQVGLERSRIDVVLPGIRLEDYMQPPAAPAGPGRPLTVGYFARLAPEKGLHQLVEAFELLSRSGEFPGLRLRAAGFLGDARYATAIRRILAARGLARQVDILGTVDRAGKLRFFREVDVLAVPTVHPEPKGLFVLEALASGVPVVEPRHGSFPELLEATGGGLLHEPGNPGDLAAKLSEVLRSPELRADLGRRGREAVIERFSAARMAAETLAIYRQIAAGVPGARSA